MVLMGNFGLLGLEYNKEHIQKKNQQHIQKRRQQNPCLKINSMDDYLSVLGEHKTRLLRVSQEDRRSVLSILYSDSDFDNKELEYNELALDLQIKQQKEELKIKKLLESLPVVKNEDYYRRFSPINMDESYFLHNVIDMYRFYNYHILRKVEEIDPCSFDPFASNLSELDRKKVDFQLELYYKYLSDLDKVQNRFEIIKTCKRYLKTSHVRDKNSFVLHIVCQNSIQGDKSNLEYHKVMAGISAIRETLNYRASMLSGHRFKVRYLRPVNIIAQKSIMKAKAISSSVANSYPFQAIENSNNPFAIFYRALRKDIYNCSIAYVIPVSVFSLLYFTSGNTIFSLSSAIATFIFSYGYLKKILQANNEVDQNFGGFINFL